jgi:hypothetical protein
MITIFDAIYALNSNIVSIRNEDAFDADGNAVQYDKAAAQTKLAELQAEETARQETEVAAKQSAQSKLTALGLTEDEVKALLGIA